MHLPWSEAPEDEFLSPDGNWYYSFRAIVLDSWLLWRDALPLEPELRQLLDEDIYDSITALARRLHAFHQTLPNYKQLADSPFKVTRWWDPSDDDPFWSKGRSCLFRLDGYTSQDIAYALSKKTPLKTRVVTQRYIEVNLPDEIRD